MKENLILSSNVNISYDFIEIDIKFRINSDHQISNSTTQYYPILCISDIIELTYQTNETIKILLTHDNDIEEIYLNVTLYKHHINQIHIEYSVDEINIDINNGVIFNSQNIKLRKKYVNSDRKYGLHDITIAPIHNNDKPLNMTITCLKVVSCDMMANYGDDNTYLFAPRIQSLQLPLNSSFHDIPQLLLPNLFNGDGVNEISNDTNHSFLTTDNDSQDTSIIDYQIYLTKMIKISFYIFIIFVILLLLIFINFDISSINCVCKNKKKDINEQLHENIISTIEL